MTDLLALGAGVASDLIPALIKPQRQIGSIRAHVTISEDHVDEMTITTHPTDRGAPITDHAFKQPARLTLRVGWSNSYQGVLVSALSALPGAAGAVAATAGAALNLYNQLTGSDYVSAAYKALLKMQEERQLLDVVTGKRKYRNMLIARLSVTTNVESEQALFATVSLQEVFLVEAKFTYLPAADKQGDPTKTGPVLNAGPQQLQPAPQANISALNQVLGSK